MNESKISVRYARALFESAIEKKVLDDVIRDMIYISGLCQIHEVKELLKSPIIVPSKKNSILRAILGDVNKLTMSLIDLVVVNGRESFIPAIARVFLTETKKYKGITESELTTAIKVDAKVKDQIVRMMSDIFGTKVELEEIIDKSIIGGFILKVDDNYIDASIKNKLRKIDKELKNGIGTV